MNTISYRVTNTQRQVGGGTMLAKNFVRKSFGKPKMTPDDYRRLAQEAASVLILYPKEADELAE